MSATVDWGRVILEATVAILGEPKSKRRTEYRWRRRGSLQVNVAGQNAGTWHDYEAGVGGGAIALVRHLQECNREDAVRWLRAQELLPDADSCQTAHTGYARTNHRFSPAPHTGTDDRDRRSRMAWARDTWDRTEPIPRISYHPARQWFAHRRLWYPQLPVPDCLRWLPASREKRAHSGCGSIVALAATPIQWALEWPHLPDATGVQLIAITAEGDPAVLETRSGHVGKQSRGVMRDAVVFIGCPLVHPMSGSFRVAEGLADALALGARYEGPAVATLSAGTMRSPCLATWLAVAQEGVVVHADADDAGCSAASYLRRAVNADGGRCSAVLPVAKKDPAAAAANLSPLRALPPEWKDFAITLRDCQPEWPAWEVYRVTGAALTERGPTDREPASGGRP